MTTATIENKVYEEIQSIVERDIYSCQTYLVEELFSNGTFQYEDIENYYNYEERDNMEEKLEEKQEELEDLQAKMKDLEAKFEEVDEKLANIEEDEELEEEGNKLEDEICELQEKIETLEDEIYDLENEIERFDPEPNDIFEWWLVSGWLASKLKAHGEPVLDNDYDTWWGRTCCGQAIKMDYIMEVIAKEVM